MTSEEQKRLQGLNEKLPKEVSVLLQTVDDERTDLLRDFCSRLADAAPKVRVIEESEAQTTVPGIRIHPGLLYHAVPLGGELDPFLEALTYSGAQPSLPSDLQEQLDAMAFSADLRLYVAPQCTFCPSVVRRLLPLPFCCPHIELAVIDGLLFPEMAEKHGVKSVPTLILDNEFRWTGTVQMQDLVNVLLKRDPSQLTITALENMMMEGNAGSVASMILKTGEIFPKFLDLLTHSLFSVRLGAMVVMEELIERNPVLANQAVEPLWERFARADTQIQGDIVYLLGEVGARNMISNLEDVLKGDYKEEVKEAAKEALEKIEEA